MHRRSPQTYKVTSNCLSESHSRTGSRKALKKAFTARMCVDLMSKLKKSWPGNVSASPYVMYVCMYYVLTYMYGYRLQRSHAREGCRVILAVRICTEVQYIHTYIHTYIRNVISHPYSKYTYLRSYIIYIWQRDLALKQLITSYLHAQTFLLTNFYFLSRLHTKTDFIKHPT